MSEHCPQDGGFIGDAGCTHPNHQHSELVKGIIVNAAPRGYQHLISESDAEAALKEGFYVKNPEGKQVGFGKKLLEHIDSDTAHSPADAAARKQRLIYAVSTVTHPDKVENSCLSNFFWFSHPFQTHSVNNFFEFLIGLVMSHFCINQTWCYSINTDIIHA